MYSAHWLRFLLTWQVFPTLTEVFPCFFLSCKANARLNLQRRVTARTLSHYLLFVLFGCYFCCSVYCLCVNVCCYRLTTQLQLINISYHITSKPKSLFWGSYICFPIQSFQEPQSLLTYSQVSPTIDSTLKPIIPSCIFAFYFLIILSVFLKFLILNFLDPLTRSVFSILSSLPCL
jgi:hypothetical protein